VCQISNHRIYGDNHEILGKEAAALYADKPTKKSLVHITDIF
jgi:hypothetical protein